MSAKLAKLRDPSRRLRIEAVPIRAQLAGPIWRGLARTQLTLWAYEGAPDPIGVVEVEEGSDCAYVLTAQRWHQLRRYVETLEDRLEELDPSPAVSGEETPA